MATLLPIFITYKNWSEIEAFQSNKICRLVRKYLRSFAAKWVGRINGNLQVPSLVNGGRNPNKKKTFNIRPTIISAERIPQLL